MKKFKILILFFLILNTSYSKDLIPNKTYLVSAGVSDIIKVEKNIYVSTQKGTLEKINLNTKKIEILLTMPKVKNFRGELKASKIYSLDIIKKTILILSQGIRGARELSLYKDSKLINILSSKKNLFIARAKFINENFIIFSTLSNQLYLFDTKNKKYKYIKQVSASKFSNFVLNENKSEIIIADESGDLQVYNVNSGEKIKSYENQNLDNIFQVVTKNGIILTAGQDRRAVVYNQGETYSKKVQFLIYSCGLSPSGNLAAIANDEDNNVLVFNTKSKKNLYSLKKNKMTLTNILFLNEKEILVTSDDKNITHYKLKD